MVLSSPRVRSALSHSQQNASILIFRESNYNDNLKEFWLIREVSSQIFLTKFPQRTIYSIPEVKFSTRKRVATFVFLTKCSLGNERLRDQSCDSVRQLNRVNSILWILSPPTLCHNSINYMYRQQKMSPSIKWQSAMLTGKVCHRDLENTLHLLRFALIHADRKTWHLA